VQRVVGHDDRLRTHSNGRLVSCLEGRLVKPLGKECGSTVLGGSTPFDVLSLDDLSSDAPNRAVD
jgi:hypothetical protein